MGRPNSEVKRLMKSPAEAIVGFLFTITSMTFWYGSYGIFFIQHVFVRYWWALLAVGLAFTAGKFF